MDHSLPQRVPGAELFTGTSTAQIAIRCAMSRSGPVERSSRYCRDEQTLRRILERLPGWTGRPPLR